MRIMIMVGNFSSPLIILTSAISPWRQLYSLTKCTSLTTDSRPGINIDLSLALDKVRPTLFLQNWKGNRLECEK